MMAPTSSPSQALDFHLSMFRRSHAEASYVAAVSRATEGSQQMAMEVSKIPNTYRWMMFASTYSRPAMEWDPDKQELVEVGGGPAYVGYVMDGRSNSEKEVVMTRDNFSGPVLQTGIAMASMEWQMLDAARTLFITSEMRNLVSKAAELAEPEPLFATDLPYDSGLIVFETPLLVDDLHPETGDPLGKAIMPIRAMGWKRVQVGARDGSGPVDGVVFVNYTTGADYAEHFIPGMAELGITDIEQPIPDDVWPIEYHPWAFGQTWSSVDRIGEQSAGKLVSTVAYHRRWMLTLFRTMWQRIANPTPWTPSRQHRRQIERSKIKPRPDGEAFTVLVLRRFEELPKSGKRSDPDEWADWPWPHRIPVDCHWKRQHYPSLGPARNEDGSFNPDSHRLIFIDDYARGPEHLPILQRHGITAVVR